MKEKVQPLQVRNDRHLLKEIIMGSIEDLADVFFGAGRGLINTFVNAAQGLFDIVKGSLA